MNIGIYYADVAQKGGYPPDVRKIACGLSELGNKVTLIFIGGDSNIINTLESFGNLELLILNANCFGMLDSLSKSKLENVDVDLIHVFGIFVKTNLQVVSIFKNRGLPIILSPLAHLTESHLAKHAYKKVPYMKVFTHRVLNKVSGFHVLSSLEGKQITKYKKANFIVPFGIHEHNYKESMSSVTKGKKKTILYIGRMDIYHKGLDVLLEGYSEYIKRRNNQSEVVLAIYGAGGKKCVSKLIRQLGIDDEVILGGQVSEKEKFELLESAYVFIYPSRWDGNPRSVREAFSMGLPVIITDETNYGDLVRTENAGVVVNLSPLEIANAIECVISEQEYKLKKQGAERVRELINWTRLVTMFADGYMEVLANIEKGRSD